MFAGGTLFLLGALSGILGGIIVNGGETVFQEIAGLLLVVTASVFIGSAAIVREIAKTHQAR